MVFAAILSGAEPNPLQPAQYSVQQWGPGDGLPEEQIFGFAQTPDGFLWLATAHGMVRFDGARFSVFQPEDNESAMASVMIAAQPAGPSDLWVWARDGSAYRFRKGKYELLSRGMGSRYPMPDYLQIAKRALWIPGDPSIIPWFPGAKPLPTIPDAIQLGETLTAWTEDILGNQWFGTSRARILKVSKGVTQRAYTLPGSPKDVHVLRLMTVRSKLAVATTAGYFELENDAWRRYSNQAVTSLVRDGEDRIWAGTLSGLAVCDQGRWMLFRSVHGLPEDAVFATLLDSEGNLWASFERTGLFRIKSPRITAFGVREGLSSDRALGLLHANSGIWVSGETAVDHLNGGKIFRIPLPVAKRRIRSLIEDKDGTVWIATSDHVLRVNPETHVVRRVDADESRGYIVNMFQTDEGVTWLVQVNGLSRLINGRFAPAPFKNLPVPFPLRVQMAQTADGQLWLSVRNRGLYRLSGEQATPALADEASMRRIHVMYADGGDLWLGLDGDGLARLRRGQLSFFPVQSPGGGQIYGLAEDDSGHLWLGMRSSLVSLAKADLNRFLDGDSNVVPQRRFDSTDGMRSANFGLSYTPATSKKTSVVWMATLQGIIRIDPARLRPNPNPPMVTFREFIGDTDKQLSLENGVLRVPPDIETFRVLAEAPGLTEASKVRFRRKLENYDSDWISYEGGYSSFTRLPPGEYTLRVTACNSDGVWSETGSSLRIVKLPAFSQTWWFYLMVACAVSASIWFLARWWTRLLRNRNLELELHVRQRTEELEKAKLAAESAAQTKADFLATMSHEIRTPMHGVLGTLDLLAATVLSNEQKDYVTTISQSSNTLLALLNDVLDLSKLEAGRMELNNAPFSLRTVASQVVRPFDAGARAKQIRLGVWINPALPQYVIGDKPRIRQILFNLVGNAVKFTDTGKVELRIDGNPTANNHWNIAFSVVDTGIGIPQQHLASLFEKFHQVDGSLSRRHGGTGLGLAICRRLADLMNGSLTVESSAGAGSVFCLSVSLEQTSRAPAADSSIDSEGIAIRFKGHVLLVEDNAINRRLAQSLLEKLGCHVEVAVNGLEAVAKSCSAHYDLILMDCQMPEMDGIEATREIRNRIGQPLTPIIVAMTANAMEGDRERCVTAGMNDYLAKPFHLRDLVQMLERHLEPVNADTPETLGTVFSIDSPRPAC